MRFGFLRRGFIGLLVALSLVLSGCVKYDVGVSFNHPNSGELVQHIKLGDRLTSFSNEPVQEWLNSIERRARQLEGRSKRISKDELVVKIPFSNAKELETKFNEFFNPTSSKRSKSSVSDSELPKIESLFTVDQNNFLLVVRNHLRYDLDLTSLSLISSGGNTLINPGSILDLDFSLSTPLGARSIEKLENALHAEKNGNQLVWKLVPGAFNHVEAVFWLPSPLGIGALLIILLVWGGLYLRYTKMPDPRLQVSQLNQS